MAHPDAMPALPDDQTWASVGVSCGREIHGGHQSRVFAAERRGEHVVVKLVDSRLVDTAFERRLAVLAAVAEIDQAVVGPVVTKSGLVAELGDWHAVVFPFVDGRLPDVDDEHDVELMASAMAELHRSFAQVGDVDLPMVAALAGSSSPADADGFGPNQLLHGDFSQTNLILTAAGARVLDFDDCGYGPVEFEVGNTLYMVLFDAATTSNMARFELFRERFVDGYRSASGRAVTDESLDRSIALRIDALARWLDHPETAPIGIRTAPATWSATLREFVRSQTRH